jgi:hypothetical protein
MAIFRKTVYPTAGNGSSPKNSTDGRLAKSKLATDSSSIKDGAKRLLLIWMANRITRLNRKSTSQQGTITSHSNMLPQLTASNLQRWTSTSTTNS